MPASLEAQRESTHNKNIRRCGMGVDPVSGGLLNQKDGAWARSIRERSKSGLGASGEIQSMGHVSWRLARQGA